MKERYLWKAAAIAAFLFILAGPIQNAIASMSVSPVRVDLSDDHDKDVVRVTNSEETAKSYQVEIVAWSQSEERREIYSPTEDLLAVPPLFTLEPGEEQLVRIGLLEPADASVERSYRMFITELAPQQSAGVESVGINMRLQIGIPVFVAPSQGIPTATLDYVDSKKIGDNLFMRFRNYGNSHVKVTEVGYTPRGNTGAETTPAVLYLLAGQSGYLPVAIPEGELNGTVTIVTDGLGSLEYELPVIP